MTKIDTLKKEAESFDRQTDERIKQGFIPDLRRLKNVDWFYNNIWRDPEFVKIHLMPKINFVLDIARQKGGTVLELGCGYGYLTLELARNGLNVTGVDLSPASIDIAKKFAGENKFKKNFGSLTYLCDDIMSMDISENKFDTIIFFGTLHHIGDINELLFKVWRALKSEGNLIVCEPIRNNFTKESAEFAAILRAVLPTWIPHKKKLEGLDNSESWKLYVGKIFNEYTYKDEHEQSPCDNITSSEDIIVNAINKYFKTKTIQYSDAFIDKLIGGLRGENKYVLAKFLKFLDDNIVERKILPYTFIKLHAIKSE